MKNLLIPYATVCPSCGGPSITFKVSAKDDLKLARALREVYDFSERHVARSSFAAAHLPHESYLTLCEPCMDMEPPASPWVSESLDGLQRPVGFE